VLAPPQPLAGRQQSTRCDPLTLATPTGDIETLSSEQPDAAGFGPCGHVIEPLVGVCPTRPRAMSPLTLTVRFRRRFPRPARKRLDGSSSVVS
jgi:hypothetical protein